MCRHPLEVPAAAAARSLSTLQEARSSHSFSEAHVPSGLGWHSAGRSGGRKSQGFTGRGEGRSVDQGPAGWGGLIDLHSTSTPLLPYFPTIPPLLPLYCVGAVIVDSLYVARLGV